MPEYLITDMAPKPKARPRVTRNGTWMPHDYQAWRKAIRDELMLRYPEAIPIEDKRSRICVLYYGPKPARGDWDNLIGGIQDAIILKDDYGLIKDDRLLRGGFYDWIEAKEQSIVIGIYKPEELDLYRARILSALGLAA